MKRSKTKCFDVYVKALKRANKARGGGRLANDNNRNLFYSAHVITLFYYTASISIRKYRRKQWRRNNMQNRPPIKLFIAISHLHAPRVNISCPVY